MKIWISIYLINWISVWNPYRINCCLYQFNRFLISVEIDEDRSVFECVSSVSIIRWNWQGAFVFFRFLNSLYCRTSVSLGEKKRKKQKLDDLYGPQVLVNFQLVTPQRPSNYIRWINLAIESSCWTFSNRRPIRSFVLILQPLLQFFF